jgi:hypothetical protein
LSIYIYTLSHCPQCFHEGKHNLLFHCFYNYTIVNILMLKSSFITVCHLSHPIEIQKITRKWIMIVPLFNSFTQIGTFNLIEFFPGPFYLFITWFNHGYSFKYNHKLIFLCFLIVLLKHTTLCHNPEF